MSMRLRRAALALARISLLVPLAASACPRKHEFEDINPAVPGAHFKRIATISADASHNAIRLMITVRDKLKTAGIDAQPSSGRWESAADAVSQVCAPGVDLPVDGVLIMSYDHMTLYDCQTARPAYDIQGSPMSGGMGIDEMTKHLIKYLQGKSTESGRP